MSPITRILTLIGSPRAGKSTSAALAHLLTAGLAGPGVTIEEVALTTAVRAAQRRDALLAAAAEADLIILAFPIYVDSLPAPVVRALELLAEHWAGHPHLRRPRLAALANCGFPEALHCETALLQCEQFARETGLRWYGGIGVGEGGMLGELLAAPAPDAPGKPTRRLCLNLQDAAAALRADRPIPPEVLAQLARPTLPHRLYTLLASARWHWLARGNRAWSELRQTPYKT